MTNLQHHPLSRPDDLGHPIPSWPHATSVCMPTWADNVAYEEGEPTVVSTLKCGYPRFVIHPFVRELFDVCRQRFAGSGETSYAFPTSGPAQRFVDFLRRHQVKATLHEYGINGVVAVVFPESATKWAKMFWQHSGEGVSWRLAEATLAQRSNTADDDVYHVLQRRIGELYSVGADDVLLFPTGMAAVFALYTALQKIRPTSFSAQFGFPYVDTLKIQQRFGSGLHFFPHGTDDDLKQLAHHAQASPLLGIFTEFPANPLLRSPDLDALAKIGRDCDTPIVVDDTVSTPFNLNLTATADAVVSSLTKFFSGAGDVMGGVVVLRPDGPWYPRLMPILKERHQQGLWGEDAAVLLANSTDFETRMAAINKNAEALSDFLYDDPRVDHVYYPKYQDTAHYNAFRQPHGGYGGLLSILLANAPTAAPRFFDALAVSKGPSLGTNFTLACPYTILAHYDELEFVESCNVSRYLVRVSVGLEELDGLLGRFAKALDQT